MSALPAERRSPVVLVVDDDTGLRQQISAYLSEHGFLVHTAEHAAAMTKVLSAHEVDVIVLDVMMPGEDGLSVCRRMADARGPAVIIVSAMGEETDRIVGLELGADDYLAKPCNPRELLARVRAVLRRREESATEGRLGGVTHGFLGFRMDVSRRQLRAPNGVVILLTAGEFSLLSAFMAHPHKVLSRDRLLDLARGGETDVYDRVVDVQISRLRRKLHACCDREIIRTYRGAGYMFDAPVTRL